MALDLLNRTFKQMDRQFLYLLLLGGFCVGNAEPMTLSTPPHLNRLYRSPIAMEATKTDAENPSSDPSFLNRLDNDKERSSRSFHEHDREIDIPEPMVFDLVRRLNSQKGEYELNALGFQSGKHRFDRYDFNPEFEYAFMDGFAGELELPLKDHDIHAYKGALQYHFGEDRFHIHHGVQFIVENLRYENVNELSPLYIQAGRYDFHHSYLVMIGNRFHQGRGTEDDRKDGQLHPLINFNYFYNFSRETDLALEINLDGAGASFKDVLFMPQLHISFTHQFKLQAGVGALYDNHSWEPATAFRLILETN